LPGRTNKTADNRDGDPAEIRTGHLPKTSGKASPLYQASSLSLSEIKCIDSKNLKKTKLKPKFIKQKLLVGKTQT
jgi:hypothetical protein